MFIFTDIGAA